MSIRKAIIHQTLHGYDNGHRLIASSTNLNTQIERYLQELSDLGGSRTSGFDEYLSGYPLPKSEFYAFSKTWYASEMERPGCVWTHTLLLPAEGFFWSENMVFLLPLFRRPNRGDYRGYAKPLESMSEASLSNIFTGPTRGEQFGLRFYSDVFHSLFERIRRVVIFADDAAVHEQLVLGIWSQQWDALRRRFSFCTGAFVNRAINGEQFTLQVAPSQQESQFRSTIALTPKTSTDFIHSRANAPHRRLNSSRYERIYRSFLSLSERIELREDDDILSFVWRYGRKLSPFRKNFGWLVRIFESMESETDSTSRLEAIANAVQGKFPRKDEQHELKRELFGPSSRKLAPEEDLLHFLLFSDALDFLDLDDLGFESRFEDLWSYNNGLAEAFLEKVCRRPDFTLSQRKYLKLSSARLSTEQFLAVATKSPEVAEALLKARTELAAEAEVWRLDEDAQHYVFDLLSKKLGASPLTSRKKKLWRQITMAMLDAENDIFAYSILELVGHDAVDWVLDWWAASPVASPKDVWSEVLWSEPNTLIEWVAKTKEGWLPKAEIAASLNPSNTALRSYGTRSWIGLLLHIPANIKKGSVIDIQTFLLALGLGDVDRGSQELVKQTFSSIYSLVADDKLSQWNWQRLEPIVPSGGIIFSWDKCRRLEEALIHLITERGWPVDILLSVGDSKKVLKNLIRRADNYSRGRQALWQLKADVSSGSVMCSDAQISVLNGYFSD